MRDRIRALPPPPPWFVYLMAAVFIAASVSFFIWSLTTDSYLNSRRHASDAKNLVVAAEQATTRVAVCTALESFPQSNPVVRQLEALPYQTAPGVTQPLCTKAAS
jgi:hypothetical protein